MENNFQTQFTMSGHQKIKEINESSITFLKFTELILGKYSWWRKFLQVSEKKWKFSSFGTRDLFFFIFFTFFFSDDKFVDDREILCNFFTKRKIFRQEDHQLDAIAYIIHIVRTIKLSTSNVWCIIKLAKWYLPVQIRNLVSGHRGDESFVKFHQNLVQSWSQSGPKIESGLFPGVSPESAQSGVRKHDFRHFFCIFFTFFWSFVKFDVWWPDLVSGHHNCL